METFLTKGGDTESKFISAISREYTLSCSGLKCPGKKHFFKMLSMRAGVVAQ